MRVLFLYIFQIGVLTAFGQSGNNTVKGKILFPNQQESHFSRGAHYKHSKSKISAEKQQVDRKNDPRKNVYISLHPLDFQAKLPVMDAQMTQREKTFLPNVVAITKGSSVYFLNEDEHFHNIYSLTSKARFNIGRRPPGNVYGQKISKVGIVKLGCDIHPEMGGTVLSLDTPYFTKVGSDGTYELKNLPDGRYELRTFHPAFQNFSINVTCRGGRILVQNIDLKNKA